MTAERLGFSDDNHAAALSSLIVLPGEFDLMQTEYAAAERPDIPAAADILDPFEPGGLATGSKAHPYHGDQD